MIDRRFTGVLCPDWRFCRGMDTRVVICCDDRKK